MASMTGAMLKNGNTSKLSCKSTIRNQRETSALRCWNTPQKKMTVCGRLDKRIRLTTKQSSSLSGSEGRVNVARHDGIPAFQPAFQPTSERSHVCDSLPL